LKKKKTKQNTLASSVTNFAYQRNQKKKMKFEKKKPTGWQYNKFRYQRKQKKKKKFGKKKRKRNWHAV
jgi:hypothetical protein